MQRNLRPGNRQHNSRSAQLGFFKFPRKDADCDEPDYDAGYYWKHKNTVLNNPLINNPPVPSTLSRI